MAARLLRWIFNALFRLLTRLHVEGMENLPGSGAYIVAANHLNFFDAPMIYGLVGGPRLSGWAAEKWERHAVYGTILKLGGGIFIQRGQVDRSALESAVAWLRSGRVFGMAPEGTRSKTGGLIRGKSGVAYLAHQSGAPIVPLAHFGTERIGPSLLRLRRASRRCGGIRSCGSPRA